jgi:hypothetical protein
MITTPARPITKVIKLTHSGFHGGVTRMVRATFTPQRDDPLFSVVILESVARKFECKIKGCDCDELMPHEFECDQYDFDHNETEIVGDHGKI